MKLFPFNGCCNIFRKGNSSPPRARGLLGSRGSQVPMNSTWLLSWQFKGLKGTMLTVVCTCIKWKQSTELDMKDKTLDTEYKNPGSDCIYLILSTLKLIKYRKPVIGNFFAVIKAKYSFEPSVKQVVPTQPDIHERWGHEIWRCWRRIITPQQRC